MSTDIQGGVPRLIPNRGNEDVKVIVSSKLHFFWRSPLRDVLVRDLPIIPFPADVKAAVATAVFLHIWLAIDAGTDNVFIPFPVTTRQPAWTCHVAVAVLVNDKTLQKLKGLLFILIEVVTFGLLYLT